MSIQDRIETEESREQRYITVLYDRLDELKARASKHLASVMRQVGGTHAARSEREALAVMYTQQRAQLDAAENGLCFGRLEFDDGAKTYIGRIGMHAENDDYDQLLMDWRAEAARPFYLATAASPGGVKVRRHIKTRGRTVINLDDEVLDLAFADPNGHEGLTGESSLLAALNASRTGRMRDIVETIQAEQDHIIRSALAGVLVVEGGPGTGKTAVALHRAAFLLYTYRRQLEKRGVLVVGPNATFLRYIGQVLPSLGETSVMLATIGDLMPGIKATGSEPAEVALIKGRLAMAKVVAAAVRDRQLVPHSGIEIRFEKDIYKISRQSISRCRERARRSRMRHNQARSVFVREMLNEAARVVSGKLGADPFGGGNLMGRTDIEDLRAELRDDPEVRATIGRLWPVLLPQQLIGDLYASPRRLASAAPSLSAADRERLRRPAGSPWTPADVPLLDEAAELLGEDERVAKAEAKRRRQREEAYAQGVLDIIARDDEDDDPEILMGADMLDATRLAQRYDQDDYLTPAERAAADRTWAFGHVIVDEAQELSPMAWRTLMRRCPIKSMTIVGDIAQTGDLSGSASWSDALGAYVGNRWRHAGLTVNYRTPAEIMTVAADVLAAIDPAARPPASVRESGILPWCLAAEEREFVASVAKAAATLAADQAGEGTLAVLCPAEHLEDLRAAVRAAVGDESAETEPGGGGSGVAAGSGAAGSGAAGAGAAGAGEGVDGIRSGRSDSGGTRSVGNGSGGVEDDGRATWSLDADLERPVVVLTVREAKGLEFDSVLVAEPAKIIAESARGLGDLYVALTRATQRVGVIYTGQLPDVLSRLAEVDDVASAIKAPSGQSAPAA
ncbi:MAG TPA: ATP-binding domain-containing protein [Streptosporangiaceae bacterium]|nr:ATP-binding domain-containing protein [Streptosporangiaceae bacterium]